MSRLEPCKRSEVARGAPKPPDLAFFSPFLPLHWLRSEGVSRHAVAAAAVRKVVLAHSAPAPAPRQRRASCMM